jgi:hypothetical protein
MKKTTKALDICSDSDKNIDFFFHASGGCITDKLNFPAMHRW